jgi:S-DNA-T family DNA segregation ATPase FtsK/SpoIIIE
MGRVSKSEKQPGKKILDDVSQKTRRVAFAVVLWIAALVLLLSGFDLAGIAGSYVYQGVAYLFGWWFYILPFGLIAMAISLVRRSEMEEVVRTIKWIGGGVLFITLLGITHLISPQHAGMFGYLIAEPLRHLFELYASAVILIGVAIVSVLVLFDSKLDLGIVTLLRRIMPRKATDTDQEPFDEDEMPEPIVGGTDALNEPEIEEVRQPEEPVYEPLRDREDEVVDTPKHAPAPVAYFGPYTPPPLSILERDRGKPNVGDTKASANLIKRTLHQFGIRVEMDEIAVGPTVTRYSLKPAEGVRLSKIVALQSNLELALAAAPIRIEAPIPGKSLVGIEVPNISKATIGLASLLSSPEFTESQKPLLVALGKDISGNPLYADIGKMPHALIAGTTGSGKSVSIHALIASLLYRNGPDRLRLIMIDPKRVELTLYNNIPHLYGTPVITDARKAIMALKWAAKEMDRRYTVLQDNGVQNISNYHETVLAPAMKKYEAAKEHGVDDLPTPDTMPHIVILIDELADIMQTYPRELEASIVRLAQMSRAVGIHLILSTQRPSVNVITGLIKANIPTRIALAVSSLIDSRTILDMPGAEKLLGAGDMLFLSGEIAKPRRLQAPFITAVEVKKIVAFLVENSDFGIQTGIDFDSVETSGGTFAGDIGDNGSDDDELYEDARMAVIQAGKASTSLLQRKLRIGYGRAARLVDMLEERGVVGPADGSKPREVLIKAGTETN